MILSLPPMLLALALLPISFTLATPVDISPPYSFTEPQVVGSFTPISADIKGHDSLETRGDDDKLKTGDHDCENNPTGIRARTQEWKYDKDKIATLKVSFEKPRKNPE
jgi:hypothetical protein